MNLLQDLLDNKAGKIVVMAPIDGVSDTAFRQIVKKYGNPDVMYTEFTNVHGMIYAPERTLKHFEYEEMERPIIAQIYGNDPEFFYHAAKIIIALGFDGLDINMGCPAKNVASSGSGAALIKTPELAKQIILETKRGVADWVKDGELTGFFKERTKKFAEDIVEKNRNRLKTLGFGKPVLNEELKMKNEVDDEINDKLSLGQQNLIGKRVLIPVSVKTRIGFDEPITEAWVKHLEEADPFWIGIHGRTLKQMYRSQADYTELAKAPKVTSIPVLVNGDIQNREHGVDRIRETNTTGALIARAAFGNPWCFAEERSRNESGMKNEEWIQHILEVMVEHAELFEKYNEPKTFVQMRKHFGWYSKHLANYFDTSEEYLEKLTGFRSPKDMRIALMKVSTADELRALIGG